MSRFQVERMGYAMGARIRGLDLSQTLDDATIAELRRLWLEHLVLCFSDQEMSASQFVAFGGRFGPLDDCRTSQFKDPDNPFIQLNSNQPIAGKPWIGYKAGQNWHSDRSFTDHPDIATMLLAKDIPEVGGDTMFTNMYLAYDTLSPKMREIIDGLEAVHDAAKIKNTPRTAEYLAKRPPVVHEAVKVHPETGRKALFVSERVSKFVGMTEEESAPLLHFLTEHAVRYELTYRHRWLPKDLLMWDNRCTMHIAISDYDVQTQARHLLRCSVIGPKNGQQVDRTTGAPVEAVAAGVS